MKRNRLVIVGAGAICRELLKRIPKEYEIVLVDINPQSEAPVRKLRNDVEFIAGDATSRLTLEKAGVSEADGVILTTRNEEVNTETARVLKDHFTVPRIISAGFSVSNTEVLEELGVEVDNIFAASATGIRNRLAQKSRAAHAIGLGKNEILEVEVHPNSRLANKPVGIIAPIRWKLGLIYRTENIIVPNENTILRPHDKVIILGDPVILKTVSDILTFNFEQFPLEYGSAMAVLLTGSEETSFFDEINYLCSVFPLKKIVFLVWKKASGEMGRFEQCSTREHIRQKEFITIPEISVGAIEETIGDLKNEEGLFAVSSKAVIGHASLFYTDSGRKSFVYELSKMLSCPLLLSKGSFPYKRMMVPCAGRMQFQNMLETSLEIASVLHNDVTALMIRPMKYISAEEEAEEFDKMKKNISETSLMYKMSIRTEIKEGIPVKIIGKEVEKFDLMILDTAGWKPRKFFSFLSPDILWHAARKAPVSTLLIPPLGETL